MSLIEQLQQTPKWKEFEEWYHKYLTTLSTCTVGDKVHLDDINKDSSNDLFGGCVYTVNFCFLPIEFQKGIFEKFIADTSSCAFEVFGTLGDERYYRYIGYDDHDKYTFGELLIWYFNQES